MTNRKYPTPCLPAWSKHDFDPDSGYCVKCGDRNPKHDPNHWDTLPLEEFTNGTAK